MEEKENQNRGRQDDASATGLTAFLRELKRREVLQSAGLYAAGAWLVIEILLELLDRSPLAGSTRSLIGCVVMTGFIGGFPVAVALAWFFDINRQGISRDTAVARGSHTSAVAALLVVVAATVLMLWQLNPCAFGRVIGVAVLPCSYYGDTRYEYLGSGISDELNYRLSHLETLHVPAKASVDHVSAQEPNPVQLAQGLGLDQLVDCGIRRSPTQLSLNLQLYDPTADQTHWAGDFEGPPEDELPIIAQAFGELLGPAALNLTELAQDRINAANRTPTLSQEAWRLFQQARYEGAANSVSDGLRHASRLDPGFARAHTKLARRYWRSALALTPEQDDQQRSDLIHAAWAHVQRALAAEPLLADAVSMRRVLLAAALQYGISLAPDDIEVDQESLHARAIELRPNFAEEFLRWSRWLEVQGKRGEARDVRQRLAELDPAGALVYP